jgi:RNA polymerase sigma-70 factor (ECF subfamily)
MTQSELPDPLPMSDLSALANLLEQYRPQLLNMLRWRLPDVLAGRLDADDLVADVFAAAQPKWAAFQNQTELSAWAWLYGIARDCLSAAWIRETRGKRDAQQEIPLPARSAMHFEAGLAASITSPSSAAARAEIADRTRRALELLGPADREILTMRHYDQLSFKEGAQVLGITQNAANVRYVRALERLKKCLRQFGLESGMEL